MHAMPHSNYWDWVVERYQLRLGAQLNYKMLVLGALNDALRVGKAGLFYPELWNRIPNMRGMDDDIYFLVLEDAQISGLVNLYRGAGGFWPHATPPPIPKSQFMRLKKGSPPPITWENPSEIYIAMA